MNLTNDDALDVMVTIGRQALERGKVQQALTILGGVLTKSPNHAVAWFSLGRAHLLKGAPDHAALCYHRAATLTRQQQGAPAAQICRTAEDNKLLCGEKVLPQDWLTALQDPHLAERWATGLESVAAAAAAAAAVEVSAAATAPSTAPATATPAPPSVAATAAATPESAAAPAETALPAAPPPPSAGVDAAGRAVRKWSSHAYVVGGIGMQALLLNALLRRHVTPAATAACTTMTGDETESGGGGGGGSSEGGGSVTVTCIQSDELSRTLAGQMAAAAGLPRHQLQVLNGWPHGSVGDETTTTAAAQSPSSSSSTTPLNPEQQQQPQQPRKGNMDVLVAAGVCTARLALRDWAAVLAQARPSLSPTAQLCPSATRLMGMLVASDDLRDLNMVEVDWMADDSGGLQYGPANELLWRPARFMQVSNFRYSPLSEPFLLLPEVSAQQLLLQPQQVLGGDCGGAKDGTPRRHDLVVSATASGRVEAVVCWTEYELASGVWLSYAPHELQGRSDPPVLSPHVWQRVQYLSARPTVAAGQPVGLQVSLYGGGEDLRVEYDEDIIAVQQAQQHLARVNMGDPDTGEGCGGGLDSDLPPGEPLQPLGSWAVEEQLVEGAGGGDDDEGAGAGGAKGGFRTATDGGGSVDGAVGQPASEGTATATGATLDGQSAQSMKSLGSAAEDVAAVPQPSAASAPSSAAAAAVAGSGLILPYHMSMLNDRERTRAYAVGIRAAVAEAQALHPDQPLVVLDVGAGTGLLSMMAARAGAPCVVGCERELALAVTAGSLLSANGLTQAVSIVQAHSKDLKVAPTSSETPPPVSAAADSTAAAPISEAATDVSAANTAAGSAPTPVVHHLPRRAGLVVHEIFGTDPLSEHVLPSLSQVQSSLAAPDALFMPRAFRIVAALAHSQVLAERMRVVKPPLGLRRAAAAAAAAAEAEAGAAAVPTSVLDAATIARLERVLPVAAARALQPWAPWKTEVDLLRVPDLYLLSRPNIVSNLSFHTRPLPRAYCDTVTLMPCDPIPLATAFTRHGHGGEYMKPLSPGGGNQDINSTTATTNNNDSATTTTTTTTTTNNNNNNNTATSSAHHSDIGDTTTGAAATTATATTDPAPPNCANCIVYWFEADCGAGGWLSTRPGSGSTYFGHWTQNVMWLEPSLPMLAPGMVEAGGLRVALSAECVMDRVRFTAEWVQEEEEEEEGSGSSDDSEEEGV